MPNPILLVFIGLFTGFLAGFLGAGGGFATVVLLIAAGASVHDAVGSSLFFTIAVGLWGTILHLRQQTADPKLALALGIPSALTALVGAHVAEGLSERTLILSFGVLTGVIMVLMARPQKRAPERVAAAVGGDQELSPLVGAPEPAADGTFTPTPRSIALAVGGGAFIGIMKGLFGVGGGFLLMPYMLLVLKINEHVAVGSSLFAILIGSLVGGSRHATLGNVEVTLLLYAIPGGLVGSFLGARRSKTADARVIRRVFLVLMAASTVYLLLEAL